MDKMIAYCGIVCSECPALIATQNDDDAKRTEVAEVWSRQYGHAIKPEDINCDGCTLESRRTIGYCHICEIRKCARDKAVLNCAYCDQYCCEKLTNFLDHVPQAKDTLETLRKSR